MVSSCYVRWGQQASEPPMMLVKQLQRLLVQQILLMQLLVVPQQEQVAHAEYDYADRPYKAVAAALFYSKYSLDGYISGFRGR
ncbi:hypothetical protein D3C84_353990 [compost metagenome]